MKTYEDLQLFTPGPVSVPSRVLSAGARPMLHHRTPEFSRILIDLTKNMQKLLGTKQDVLLVHTSGRGAMEGSILNLFTPGAEILSVCNGKFGEMFAEIAERYGLTVYRTSRDWLAPLDWNEVEQALIDNPNIKAITICHCETATAVVNDIGRAADLAQKYGKLILVDCISSAGCMPIEFDQWGLDVVITASQKGLMSPTGLSMVVLSEKAWQAADMAKLPKFYINFRDIQKNLHNQKPETPGSTPVSLVTGLAEALTMLCEEGKENAYARHEVIAQAIRAGVEALGLELFPAGITNRSSALTAFHVPDSITSSKLRSIIKERFGLITAAGLGNAYKERVVRIGHMGNVYPKDSLLIIAALEASLDELNYLHSTGAGVAACIRVLRA